MQRVRKMVAGELPAGIDGHGVTVAVLDTGERVMELQDAQEPCSMGFPLP